MSSEIPIPSPIESMVASTSEDVTRLLKALAEQLAGHHAQRQEEVLAAVRHEAEEAIRLVREESEQTLERAIAQAEAQATARLVDLTREQDTALSERIAGETARLRAEFDEQLRLAQAGFDEALGAARAETERVAADATARVQAERDQATAAARAESEARIAALVTETSAADTARIDERAGEREQHLASVERLLRAMERIDEATSLRTTLDALGEAVAAEAPRSLMCVVRGDTLRGWCASGIAGAPDDVKAVAVGREAAGPLGRAIAIGTPVEVHADTMSHETNAVIGFLDLPADRAGLAVPVVVDGTAVAVVYVDDGGPADREVPASWPEAVQVLARYAARCLESLTARRAAGARTPAPIPFTARAVEPAPPAPPPLALPMAADAESARRFARLVVSELKLYNEPMVLAGRRARDLRVRLAEPIARARRQYEQRVPVSLPGRDDYFEQELVRTLAEGDPDLLGHRGLATA